MVEDNKNRSYFSDFPEKIRKRIQNHGDVDGDRIIGNGEIELQSRHPVRVVRYYLADNKAEWSDSTYNDYSYDLTRFLEYCEYADQTDLADLSARDFESFKSWRKQDGNIVLTALHGQLANIRVFIQWCERIEIVTEGLGDTIDLPDVDPSDFVSYVRIEPEHAAQIIEYYRHVEYVPRSFAEYILMWVGLCRRGDVRALDLEDYNREEGYIELKHRPDSGTPLKNGAGKVVGEGGEREVELPNWVCEILNTYIDGSGDPHHPSRIDVTDDHGRDPLFTTKFGRVSTSTIYRDLHRITQPCQHGQECPHDRDPATCDAANDSDAVNDCPSAVSPHPVRRGGICHQIDEGVSKDKICERADLSLKVLNRHYDLRSKEEARKQRREELQEKLGGYDKTGDSESSLQTQSPLLASAATTIGAVTEAVRDDETRGELAEGIVAYMFFVLVVGINFGLLGIGFNPVA